ncbi:MAG: fibronectin type III domain-containing protein [Psychroflexus sp.]|nr:fibronectin type III domain-containing protein [Psychroflexus sp.]MDN6310590.1 fibronectin type III domain-containing protein [Psychroflexus sp.]
MLSITSVFDQYKVNFDESSTDNYIAFKVTYYADYYAVYLDDITWEFTPSCTEPSDLVVDGMSMTTSDLSWTAGADETNWEVVYGPVGFNPETEGMSASVTDTPNTTLTDLDPDTDYEFYVKSQCVGAGESSLIGPESFFTFCEASSVPFFEGFENGYVDEENIAGCWSSQSGETEWKTNNGSIDNNREPRTGDWNAYLSYNNNDWIFYALELTEGVSYDLTLYARQDKTEGASISASYGLENNASAMTDEIIAPFNITNGDYQMVTGSFTPDEDGVYYIGIKGSVTYIPYYLTIDDISVVESNTCAAPSEITFSEITSDSAEVNWVENGTATEWELIYGLEGFNPETEGTSLISDADTYSEVLTDLESETTYDVYVRAICSEDEQSEFAEPKSFTTGTLSIENQVFENFKFYPNPVNAQLILQAGTQIESVKLYNMLGQSVMISSPNKLQTQLETESLQSGVYLMKVSLNGHVKTFRVLKK